MKHVISEDRKRRIVEELCKDILDNSGRYSAFLNQDTPDPSARPLTRELHLDSITSVGVSLSMGLTAMPDDKSVLRVAEFPITMEINFYPILENRRGKFKVWSEPFKIEDRLLRAAYSLLAGQLNVSLMATASTAHEDSGSTVVEADLIVSVLQTTLVVRQSLNVFSGNPTRTADTIESATENMTYRLRNCLLGGRAKIFNDEFVNDLCSEAVPLVSDAVSLRDQRPAVTTDELRANIPNHWPGILVAMSNKGATLVSAGSVTVPKMKRVRQVEV